MNASGSTGPPREPWDPNRGYPGHWPPYQPYPSPRPGDGIFRILAILLVFALVFSIAFGSMFFWRDAETPLTSDDFDPATGGTRTYTWRYDHQIYSTTLNLSLEQYLIYHANTADHAPESYQQMRSFVLPQDPTVWVLGRQLNNLSVSKGFDALDRVNFVLAFVQSIPYSLDGESTEQNEYWRYPVETLYDKTGDCEDTAILYASLLEAIFFDSVLIIYSDHVATGVACPSAHGTYFELDDRDYYYCETTGSGWEVGELPPDVSMVAQDIIQVP